MNDKYYQAAAVGYEIIIEGHLSDTWTDWFDGLTFEYTSDGSTILTGEFMDQSALHGLLKKILDLGLILLSVNRLQATEDQNEAPSVENKADDDEGQLDRAEAVPNPDPIAKKEAHHDSC
jgi:hypothetical protein